MSDRHLLSGPEQSPSGGSSDQRQLRLVRGAGRMLATLTLIFAVHALWINDRPWALFLGLACAFFILQDLFLRSRRQAALASQLTAAVLVALVAVSQLTAPPHPWPPWLYILAATAPPLLGVVQGGVWILVAVGLVAVGQSSAIAPEDLALQLLGVGAVGALVSAFGIFRRRTEAELEAEIAVRKRAEQEARAADLAKGEFLANMSHELRTPLNAVIGFTDLLLKEKLTSSQRDKVKAIDSAAEMLLIQVDEVLDLAKIEAGKLTLEAQDFQPRALLHDVLRVLKPRAVAKHLALRLSIDAAVPLVLRGDPARLRQVLVNLVGNAIKFTSEGQVTIRLEQSPDGEPSSPRWLVSDTGIGMSSETQARIFTPFTQADSSASRHFGGTGLGLAICKRLIELMGGVIGCESTRGTGSTFFFQVPLEPTEQPGDGPAEDIEVETSPTSWRRLRVLVVEDNPINRLLLVEHLKALGFQPDIAGDGYEALAAWEKQHHDLVLMDCQLPGLDGYETTRRLRELESRSPTGDQPRTVVIAVTAHALSDERDRCLAAGMDDYLSKPFRGEELHALLERWLSTPIDASTSEAP